MTPREIALEAAGFVERNKEDRNQAIYIAWLNANLVRAKEIPPYAKLIPQPPLSPAQRSAMNRARMAAFAARYNAGLKRKNRNG